MIVTEFLEVLDKLGIHYFAGVPDSLLKPLCTELESRKGYHITVNEGSAVALCAGHYLGTGETGCVFMQNSGLGNAVNPILSLIDKDVYDIPMLFVIGWRGEPGVKDEPQHAAQGRLTEHLLEALEMPYMILDESITQEQLHNFLTTIEKGRGAILVRKDALTDEEMIDAGKKSALPSRESQLFEIVKKHLTIDRRTVFVSTTGMISRELYEIREKLGMPHDTDFLTVGSMGHCGMIALGVAESNPNIDVVCIEGDGAVLMHMGNLATIGTSHLKNFYHYVLDNNAHESVGGMSTNSELIDLDKIADACAHDTFTRIKVSKGHRPDLGRPKQTPKECKENFMKYVQLSD